jgi:hypothetical protein
MVYLESGKYFGKRSTGGGTMCKEGRFLGSEVLKEGRKEDDEGSEHLGKEALAWKEGRH